MKCNGGEGGMLKSKEIWCEISRCEPPNEKRRTREEGRKEEEVGGEAGRGGGVWYRMLMRRRGESDGKGWNREPRCTARGRVCAARRRERRKQAVGRSMKG